MNEIIIIIITIIKIIINNGKSHFIKGEQKTEHENICQIMWPSVYVRGLNEVSLN